MYLSYYELKKKPFEITVDPRFLWLGEKHREALATLEYGIREEKGFLLLTGEVGAGKTVLINGLARKLDIKSIIATVPDPGLSALDFFNSLADTFDMGKNFKSKGEFLAHLKKFLVQADTDRRKVLLLIDEAQRLNHEILEEVRLLSNIELENRKLINIFFVGQTEFNDILMDPRNKAVRHRIAVRYHISNLTLEESGQYIRHRLKVAGTEKKIFTAAAIKEIFAFAGGNPRLTNIICDHALLTGYSMEQKTIDSDVIEECANDLRLPPEQRDAKKSLPVGAAVVETAAGSDKRFSLTTFIAVGVIVILLVAGGYWILNRPSGSSMPWSPDEIMSQQPPKQLLGPTPEEKPTVNSEAPGPQIAPDRVSPVVEQPPAAAQETVAVPAPTKAAGPGPAETAESKPTPPEPQFDLDKVDRLVIPFKHNSNELSADTYRLLDGFAAALLKDPGYAVSVTGYTDSTGALSYNMSISEFRANMIKSYLIGKGVNPQRITASGMGPENPVASNDTEEGRRQNRRVEIEFVKK